MFRPSGKEASSPSGACQDVQRPFLKFHVIDRRESGLIRNGGLASLWMEGSRTLELDSSIGDVVQRLFSQSPSVSVRRTSPSRYAMSLVGAMLSVAVGTFLLLPIVHCLCSVLALRYLRGTELCLSIKRQFLCFRKM